MRPCHPISSRSRTGEAVAFRHIRPDDKGNLAAAFGRLSPESQHKRFLAAKPRFSASDLRYLTEIDGFDHVASWPCSPTTPTSSSASGASCG